MNLKSITSKEKGQKVEVFVKTGGFGQYCSVWDKVRMFGLQKSSGEKHSFRETKV